MIGETWKWCLYPHTESEIRERVLSDYNDICFDYLCSYSRMTEEFRTELAVLSLGKTRMLDDYEIVIKPYITKKNYKSSYESLKAAYLWVQNDFSGRLTNEVLEGIKTTKFKESIETSLNNAKKRKTALLESLRQLKEKIEKGDYIGGALDKKRDKKSFKDKRFSKKALEKQQVRALGAINNITDKINIYESELDSLNALFKRRKKPVNDVLKKDLKSAFTDRLPDEDRGIHKIALQGKTLCE